MGRHLLVALILALAWFALLARTWWLEKREGMR